jgi:hypothetical protein
MSTTVKVTQSLLSAPLPTIVEKLGVAIADAQRALDANSLASAKAMAQAEVRIGEDAYNLLSLGFTPTFYAFTEATVEAKLSFSMTESEDVSVGGSLTGGVNAGIVMVAATVSASYARRFSVNAEGSSSLAARLVALPPPDALTELLRNLPKPTTTPGG